VSFTESVYRAQERLKDLHQEALESLLQQLVDAGMRPTRLEHPARSHSPFSQPEPNVVGLVIVRNGTGAELGRVWVEYPDPTALEPSYEIKVRSVLAV
jgi:hypothetical protein